LIAELSLSGVTASKADIRIRDKVNELVRAVNGAQPAPVPIPVPPADPQPAPVIAISTEQEAAIMAVPVAGFFTLQGPTRNIVCAVNG
jgi:hypothetical protein